MAFEKIHLPVYRQIYEILASELNRGLYDEKGMLPSEKELCARFGVERNTIRKSLQLLVEEDRVIRRPGLGTELVKPREEADLNAAGDPVVLITQVDYLNTGKGESFHYKLIHSLGKRLGESGCNMLFKPVYKPEDFSELLCGVPLRGIIFDSHNQNDYYRKMIQRGLPALSLNQYTPLITSIVSDNFGAAHDVARRLFQAGHRRIIYILGKPNYNSCQERLNGIRQFYADQGLQLDEEYLFGGDWLFGSGVDAAARILGMEKEKRPTAVFAFNDDMAYGCYSALTRGGILVPEDISIVGFDHTNRYVDVFPPISTVDVNLSVMVDYAAWYFTETLAGKAPQAPARIEIPTTFCDLGTTAAAT
ncbi:MAG: GntR family transcriptional regulator [Treponema sp.]|jgi:DNA-binding LacI/PurR family transcriptional regulator|nr:GntR family transcriptional regulator [Treponema sp.]